VAERDCGSKAEQGDPTRKHPDAAGADLDVADRLGDAERVRLVNSTEGLALFRGIGDVWGIGHATSRLGPVQAALGDLDVADATLEESLSLRSEGDKGGIGVTLQQLGLVALRKGGLGRAATALRESLALLHDVGSSLGTAGCLEGLALLGIARREHAAATRLLGAASSLRGSLLAPSTALDHAALKRGSADARAALGDEAFDAAWAEGRAMTLEQAVAYALDEQPPA
jgi:hypothetical protein